MEIYHYTSAFGLLSILNGKMLWGTHFNYLNDESEYGHAKEIILNVIDDSKNEEVKRHKEILKICLNQIYSINDIYTCSFSTEPNLLSQWRSYCPKDGGFSIGFGLEELIILNGESFYECIYKIDRKKQAIEPLIVEFCKNVEKIIKGIKLQFPSHWEQRFEKMLITPYSKQPQIHPLDLEKNHIYIRYELALLAARMKDEAFFEENEFRYIYVASKKDINGIKYRSKDSLVIPYKELNFNSNAVKSIYIGPSVNQKRNWDSIEMLKNSVEMNFDITESKIPYRGW